MVYGFRETRTSTGNFFLGFNIGIGKEGYWSKRAAQHAVDQAGAAGETLESILGIGAGAWSANAEQT
jgi:hypothetical protein